MVQQFENKNNEKEYIIRMFRSPTLETVKMVEEAIKKYNGEFKRTQIWGKLPRKIMWPTYVIILNYLDLTFLKKFFIRFFESKYLFCTVRYF